MTPRDSICPSCGHPELTPFYQASNLPICCTMSPQRQDALNFPCGDVELGFCPHCGFITNLAFDPTLGAAAFNLEDQQGFSPTFKRFATGVATGLIDRYNLRQKRILEIGCSKGDFLFLLCELGDNHGVGIDPIAVPGRVPEGIPETMHDRVSFIADYYSDQHAEYVGDLIACRHTLEHIHSAATFLKTLRRSIGDRLHVNLFFEIPDTVRILKEAAFEDIYYEHCSYFTPGSLARLFRHCGFAITDLRRAYADQYLLLEARPVSEPSEEIHPLEETVTQTIEDIQQFARRMAEKSAAWRSRLAAAAEQNQRIVIWGSGSKCVSFLASLDAGDQIEYIVDINPHRQGQFTPGLGKEIVSPAFLQAYRPDQIIVMNPIYCGEIQQMLDDMQVPATLVPLQ